MNASAAAISLSLLLATVEGVVVEGYPGALRVKTASGDVVGMAMSADGTCVLAWDGTPLPWEAARPGERVRVECVGEYYSAYAAGTAIRVVVGPPEDGPDFGFDAAVESFVAGTDREARSLVRDLGSRSWAARERATDEIKGMGRERAAGVLTWGLEHIRDAEARHRIGGIMRSLWLEVER